jgi:nitrate reductase NapD
MSMNRRQLLTAKPASCHIVSLVVQVRQDKFDQTIKAIEALPGAEVPTSDASGKLVVLLEHEDEAGMLGTITAIEHTPGVISAALAYHQIDDQQG